MKKTAIVTGGSSGIGYCVGEKLAQRDYSVYLLARDAQRGLTAADRIRTVTPGAEVHFIGCDVRSTTSVNSAIAEVRSRADSADVLVNCAGVLNRSLLGEASGEEIDAQLDTCLKGTIVVTGAAVELLSEAESALVVNVGSVAGREPFESLTVYGAAKAGVIHFSRIAAKELYARGIRVLCVNPGVVQTGLMSAAELSLIQSTLPGRRLQQPEEIATFIAELTGGAYSSLTGAVIDLDDGAALFTGAPARVDGAPRRPATRRAVEADAAPGKTDKPAAEPTPDATAAPTGELAPKLGAIFQRVFGIAAEAVHSDLSPDDVFKWDSIGHIRLVGAIEQDTGVTFDVDEIMELTSFRAILEILARKEPG